MPLKRVLGLSFQNAVLFSLRLCWCSLLVFTVGLENLSSLLSGNLPHCASCTGSDQISSKPFLSFVASQHPVFR